MRVEEKGECKSAKLNYKIKFLSELGVESFFNPSIKFTVDKKPLS